MELSKKREYILSFVAQGLPLSDAFDMCYATDDDRQDLEADDAFMEEVNDISLSLATRAMREYNAAVSESKSPADHLRRLAIMRARVFDKEDKDKLPDLNITINKVTEPVK